MSSIRRYTREELACALHAWRFYSLNRQPEEGAGLNGYWVGRVKEFDLWGYGTWLDVCREVERRTRRIESWPFEKYKKREFARARGSLRNTIAVMECSRDMPMGIARTVRRIDLWLQALHLGGAA